MKRLALYPFLLAAYPVLFLLAQNSGQVELVYGIRSLIIVVSGALVLFLVGRLAGGDSFRAALLVATAVILFFSYGHIYPFLKDAQVAGFHLGRHRYLLAACGLILFASGWGIRRLKNPAGWNLPLNAAAAFLVLFSAGQIMAKEVQARFETSATLQSEKSRLGVYSVADQLNPPPVETMPDIYFIGLDTYARDDALAELFGFDNQPFLNQLVERGFFIPTCQQSNYSITTMSLGSTLQMDYLPEYAADMIAANKHWREFSFFIRNNRVRETLEALGYKTVTVEHTISWLNMTDAAVYIRQQDTLLQPLLEWRELNSFEKLLLNTTMLRAVKGLTSEAAQNDGEAISAARRVHYEQTLYTLSRLEQIPDQVQGPKFVFVHLVAPHDPHVFAPDGSYVPEEHDQAYADEIIYLNRRLIELVDIIQKASDGKAIILFQGDHGFGWAVGQEQQMHAWNFAAYYLPDGGNADLNVYISPVNVFRTIFNRYFGGNLEILEDIAYQSYHQEPFQFTLYPALKQDCNSRELLFQGGN